MRGGVIRLLEGDFKKSMHWFLCLLHTNELQASSGTSRWRFTNKSFQTNFLLQFENSSKIVTC